MDLSAAEALGNLLEARTRDQLTLAHTGMRGKTGDRCREIYERLRQILAAVYVTIDYPDEDLADMSREEIAAAFGACAKDLRALCDTYRTGHAVAEGIRTVICGKPNVGKSSLFNRLVGRDAAIVTDVEGTTRDVLTATASAGRVTLNLCDTAGLHDTGDPVERIGVERAKKALAEADVRALVLDSASPLTEEDKAALFGLAPQMIVLSKGDLAQRLTAADVRAAFGDVPMVTVCATRGEGMEALRDALTAFVPADGAESSALSQARHVEAAGRARAALCDAVTAIEDGMPLDVAAVDLSAALDAMGEITGETMSERVIDEVFAKFCVGK